MEQMSIGLGRPHKATREAMVRTAWELFEEVGFEAASMSAIADRAGVSRRTLFNYFPHKAALLFHGSEEFMAAFRDELRKQPMDAPFYETLTKTFWAIAPLTEHLEARMVPGPEVAAARVREDAVAFWKGEWAREMEQLVLEVFGPDAHMRAGLVGAIVAQIWVEIVAVQRDASTPMTPHQAITLVLTELSQILGTTPR